MRRSLLAWAAVGLFAAAATPLLFAGDPAPEARADAQIARLVEDLGSDDFRVREAATKALTDMGEKARPALEAAMKSDSPAVRFRAEQILERLKGAPRERALDDGAEPGAEAPRGELPRRVGPGGMRPEEWDREMNRIREEMDRRMKEMEDLFRGGRMDLPWGRDWGPMLLGRARAAKDVRLKVDGGDVWAELHEGARSAKIVFTEKDEPANVTTFSGPSVEKILASRPQVRDWPGAKELLERYDAEKKAREAAARTESGARHELAGRSVTIVQGPDGVRVTITAPGPDGKPVTKVYEGADLETLKREHPEIGEGVDGFQGFTLRVVPPTPATPRGPRSGTPGESPLGPLDPDEDGPALPIPGVTGAVGTGPFGLALSAVDDRLRGHLGLAEGEGALVLAVRPNSDAAEIGLRVDDVIRSVNGTPVKSLDDVGRTLRSRAEGDALTFEVIRGGKAQTLTSAAKPK